MTTKEQLTYSIQKTLEQAVVSRSLVELVEEVGIPYIDTVQLPMLNIDKPWYVAHYLYPVYNGHPPASDWNLESMGNTDFDEPLGAPFNALCTSAYNWGGNYGKIIQLLGFFKDGRLVLWTGWHLNRMSVTPGQFIRVGQDVGTIGDASGVYSAHLHEQIGYVEAGRGLPVPSMFSTNSTWCRWVDTVKFYQEYMDPAFVLKKAKFDKE